jgi:hypothetical protein
MKTKLLLFLISFLLSNYLQSQINTLIDSDAMDIYDLTIDNNGNQIIVGDLRHSNIGTPYTNDFDPSVNNFSLPNTNSLNGVVGFIASYNKSGQLNYAFQINDADITPGVQNFMIESDNANNIYVYGSFTGKADFDPSANIYELNTGNIFTKGYFLASYDENGNFRYAIPFPANSIQNLFTTIPKILSVDGDGNSYLLFSYAGSFDFDHGAGEYLFPFFSNHILSYDLDGNFRFGYRVPFQTDTIGCNTSGDYFIAGTLNESTDGSLDFDPSNQVFTLGNVDNSSFFFASYTQDGNLNFVKDLKGPNAAPVKIIGNSNHIFLAGELGAGTVDFDPTANTHNVTVSNFEPDTGDMFFAKYTNNGNLVFAKAIQDKVGKVSSEIITDFEVDNDGNLFLIGSLKGGTVDFDLSSGVNELNGDTGHSSIPGDLFVASYDGNGDHRFAYAVTSLTINHSMLEFDPNCSYYYVSGTESHSSTLEFFQEGVLFQFTTGDIFGRDYSFITKIKEGTMVNGSCGTLSTDDFHNSANNINLFPNPIETYLNIDIPKDISVLKTDIYNALGQVVYSSSKHTKTIELSNLKSGIYILNITTDRGNVSYKIVKN